VLLHLILVPLALLWLLPLWLMLVFSTMPGAGHLQPRHKPPAAGRVHDELPAAPRRDGFLRSLFVSIGVAMVYTALSVLLTSRAGWALVRYRFFGKGMVDRDHPGTLTLPYFVVVIRSSSWSRATSGCRTPGSL
jgi:lactose/L-arabinose transport system permease protein